MRNLLIALLFSHLHAFAAAIPDNVVSARIEGATVIGTAASGFHFNEQAPNVVKVNGKNVTPASTEKQKITFHLATTKFDSASAMLYVCDDALTTCVPKSVDLKGAGGDVAEPAGKKGKVTRNEHGFIADDLDAALLEASRTHKLVLADFSARWCPGCVRLEKEAFGTNEFKNATRGFVKVRLDYDRFANLRYKKKYGIKGIPSLLALTPEGEEIVRVVDYQPMSILKPFLKAAAANPTPIDALKAEALGGSKSAGREVGERLYAAGRYADAVPFLESVFPAPIELRDARVQAAKSAIVKEDPVATAAFATVVSTALEEEPASTRSINWRAELLEVMDPKDIAARKKIAAEGTALADDLLANPAKMMRAFKGDPIGEFTGFEKLYLASERADLISAAELSPEETLAAMKVVTKVGRELKIPISKTGTNLRYLIFLTAAKEYEDAEKLGRAMLARDPGNPEYERRLIKIMNGRKKYADAVDFGKKVLPNSFGKNEVWVVQQLAKAYVGEGERAAAKSLVQAYLSRSDIDWSAMPAEQKDLGETLKAAE